MSTISKLDLIQFVSVRADVKGCRKCHLGGKVTSGPVPMAAGDNEYFDPTKPRVAVQGEAPGMVEQTGSLPFIGPAGTFFKDNYPGDKTQFVYLNTVSCCPDRKPPTPNKLELDSCRSNLTDQLVTVAPSYLLVLGNVALRSWWPTLSVTQNRGTFWKLPLDSLSHMWCMATYHPSFILRQGGKESENYGAWMEDLVMFEGVVQRLWLPEDNPDQLLDTQKLKKAPTSGMMQGLQTEMVFSD